MCPRGPPAAGDEDAQQNDRRTDGHANQPGRRQPHTGSQAADFGQVHEPGGVHRSPNQHGGTGNDGDGGDEVIEHDFIVQEEYLSGPARRNLRQAAIGVTAFVRMAPLSCTMRHFGD